MVFVPETLKLRNRFMKMYKSNCKNVFKKYILQSVSIVLLSMVRNHESINRSDCSLGMNLDNHNNSLKQ